MWSIMIRLAQIGKFPSLLRPNKAPSARMKSKLSLPKSVPVCNKVGEGRNAFLKMGCDIKYLTDGTLSKTSCWFGFF